MSAPRSMPSRSIRTARPSRGSSRVDLPQGDTTLIARDFPPGLDTVLAARRRRDGARASSSARSMRAPPRAERPADRARAREAARGAAGRARGARRPDRAPRPRASDSPSASPRKRRSASARRARRARSPNGARRSARSPRRSRSADDAIRDAQAEAARDRRELARVEPALQGQSAAQDGSAHRSRGRCAARAPTFRVSYTVRGARWAPLYDARLDTGTRERKPALELVRRAEIVQQTGEDWSDVALSVSTVRTAKGGSAPGAAAADRALSASRRAPRRRLARHAGPARAARAAAAGSRQPTRERRTT